MSKAVIIPPGAIFTVTSGCYSNYYVHGVFRAKQAIDAERLRDEWIAKHPDQSKPYHFDDRAFLASIASMIETVESYELHLCDYSTATELEISKIDSEAA